MDPSSSEVNMIDIQTITSQGDHVEEKGNICDKEEVPDNSVLQNQGMYVLQTQYLLTFQMRFCREPSFSFLEY